MADNALLIKAVFEFVGTLVFLYVIAKSGRFGVNAPLVIGATLAVVAVVVGPTTGGHLNPAVTLMTAMSDASFSQTTAVYYVVAQLAGAYAALHLSKLSA